MNSIVLIIPAFNESKKIASVVRKVKEHCHGLVNQILVIDDCSRDQTSEIARAEGAFVIRHEVNKGVGAAIRTGLEFARQNNYDIAVIISGDDQHDPRELKSVVTPLLEGKADFVQGSRFLKGGSAIDQTFMRKILTKIYPVIFWLLTGKRCTDVTNGFRAFRIKKLFMDEDIDLYQDWLNRYELEVYLIYKVYNSKKYRVTEVPISIYYHKNREERTKMQPILDWWRIFRPMLFLKFKLKR